MKKEIMMLLCLIMISISSFAQSTLMQENEDSTINCIAYFSKGDTVEYELSDRSYQLKDNLKDTVVTTDVVEKIRFAVLDSTSKGYRIEMAYTSFENKLKEDTSFQSQLANAMAPVLMKNKVVFTTDEYGSVKRIENWKELRDQLKDFYDDFLDTLFSKKKDKDSDSPKSLLSSIFYLQIATEPNMQKVFDEISQLFGNFGLQFSIGHSRNDESESGYKQHNSSICGYIAENDSDYYDYDDDYFLSFMNKVNIPASDLKKLGMAGLGALSLDIDEEANDSISKAFDDVFKGRDVNVYQTEDAYYFFNGWPKASVKSKYVTVGDDQIIKSQVQSISWSSRNWNYYNKKEEDTSKSL